MIPAAGLGERLGLNQPKAFVSINNWSLLSLTIKRVLEISRVGHLIVEVPADSKAEALDHIDRAMRDADRPFVPKSVFENVIERLDSGSKVVIPVIPVSDTIKTVDEKSEVLNTLDRSKLRAVQTPQGFAREVLSEIYATADLQPTTDDAGLAELAGIVVTTVEGSVESFKITTPFDLEMAQSFMSRK